MQTIVVSPLSAADRIYGPRPLVWGEKNAVEFETFVLDLSRVAGGAEIVGVAVAVSPTGTTLAATELTHTATAVYLTVQGGTPGTSYTLSFQAAMSDGERVIYDTTLPIGAGAAAFNLPVSPTSIWVADIAVPVKSVAGRTGAVTLSAGDVAGLATVATSGAYADLSGRPAIPTAYALPAAGAALGGVMAGTAPAHQFATGVTSAGVVTFGRPDASDVTGLAAVASSGAYSDLTGAPTIPIVPATVSAFANDAGYLTGASAIPAAKVTGLALVATTGTLAHTAVSDWAAATAGFLTSAPVASVAGRAGAVTLTHADLTDWAAATAGFGGSSAVTSVAGRIGAVTLTESDVSGLGGAALLSVGTAAGTVAAGDDSRIAGALQSGAIPAAAGALLGGSGTAGTASAVAIGPGLALNSGTLAATASAPAAGLVYSNGTTLAPATIGPGLALNSGTLAATGAPPGPITGAFQTGRFYPPAMVGANFGTGAPIASKLTAQPFFVPPGSPTLKSLSICWGTAPSGSYSWEAGVYADNGAGQPGSLVAGTDTGTQATGTATGAKTATYGAPVALAPGWYWAAVQFSGSPTGACVQSGNSSNFYVSAWLAATGGAAAQNGFGQYTPGGYTTSAPGTFGTLPATFTNGGTVSTSAVAPVVVMGF